MDAILAKALNQAVLFAVRLGISLALGYAIKTLGKYVESLPAAERTRLVVKKTRLQQKIEVVLVLLELIKLASGRNSVLEVLLELVSDLFMRFNEFGDRVKLIDTKSAKTVEKYMDELTQELLEALPVINMVLTTLGVSFTQKLDRMSPGNLMRAAVALQTQVIDFDLVMYLVFYNGNDGVEGLVWKEEYARALVKVKRVKGDRFNHQLVIKENFDDERYHDDADKARSQTWLMNQIVRMFYGASGQLLRLESRDTPVLIVKVHDESDKWLALGEWRPQPDSDSETEDDESDDEHGKKETPAFPHTLSLLEYVIRLAKAEANEQQPVLELKDEVLLPYLSDDVDRLQQYQSLDDKRQHQAHKDTVVANSTMKSNVEKLERLNLE